MKAKDHLLMKAREPGQKILDLAPLHALAETHRDTLVRLFASVLPFVHEDEKDKTYVSLQRVEVEVHGDTKIMLLATDGFAVGAVAAEFADPHGLLVGDIGLTRASVKRFIRSKGTSALDLCLASENFPRVRLAISNNRTPFTGVFHANPRYFSKCAEAMERLGYSKKREARFEMGADGLAPILVVPKVEYVGKAPHEVRVSPLFVLMPMRDMG